MVCYVAVLLYVERLLLKERERERDYRGDWLRASGGGAEREREQGRQPL